MLTKDHITTWFKKLQDDICQSIAYTDGKGIFKEDLWQREGGGGGRTRIIEQGNILEKGGVAFSAVHGKTPENILKALQLESSDFFATGVSIVMHPYNPMVPIIHMNVRYFEMSNGISWFGGGIDLTPHYVDIKEARFFHQQLKQVCDKHDETYYERFKKWADNYFYIKHRKETRGIGGVFFDRVSPDEHKSKSDIFAFVQDIGLTFAPVYTHFMRQNANMPFGEKEKEWQLLRRGRYVEFNLVLDKGTKFGLDTNGRTESILMSLPPHAGWQYNYKPPMDSKEALTLQYLKKGIDWANII